MNAGRETRIRQRAFEIWERENRPDGREQLHWTLAEAEIDAEDRRIAEHQRDVATAGPSRAAGVATNSAEAEEESVLKKVGRRYVETISNVAGAAANAAVDAIEDALPKPARGQTKAAKPRGEVTKGETVTERPAITVRPAKRRGGASGVWSPKDVEAAAKPTRGRKKPE